MDTSREFVPVTVMRTDKSVVPGDIVFPWGTTIDKLDWGIRPTSLKAKHIIFKGRRPKRGREASILAVDVYAQIVVRRSVLQKVLAGFPDERLEFVPVALFEEGELLDDDFALLDPKLLFPIDRDASTVDWAAPDNPHGSLSKVVRKLQWGNGRAPDVTAFRLGEQPHIILMRRNLAEALEKATKQAIVIATAPYPGRERRFSIDREPNILVQYQEHGVEAQLAPWQPADEAALSGQAFWELWAGRGDATTRALALRSPHYAFWLARLVNLAPADDTRQAALQHPHYAYRYANQVDRATRDDTRLAASRVPLLASLYSRFVDHAAHDMTRQGVAGTDWAAQYDKDIAEAQRSWALATGGADVPPAPAKPTPPPLVAPRIWPVHDRPRYAESSPDPAAETAHDALNAELRSDVDAFIDHGLAYVGLGPDATPEAVVSAIHVYTGEVQAKTRKLGRQKQRIVMALGCAYGEQVHRALGWQWADVRTPAGGGIALVNADRSVAFYALYLIERLLEPGQTFNSVALGFNMVADGALPPGSAPGAYAALA